MSACFVSDGISTGYRNILQARPSLLYAAVRKVLVSSRRQSSCRLARDQVRAAAAADDDDAGGDLDPMPTGSRIWRARPAAVALSSTLRNPAAWFILGGFLKIVALTVSAGTYPFGGLFDLTVSIPAAIVLMLAAAYIEKHQLMMRKLFPWLLILGGGVLLFLSGLWYSGQQRRNNATWHAQNRPVPVPTALHAPQQQRQKLPNASDAEGLGVSWESPTAEFRRGRSWPPRDGPET